MTQLKAWGRNLLACLTAVVLTGSWMSVLPTAAASTAVTVGDCDSSGTVDMADIYLLRDYLMGTAAEISAGADLDGDAAITAADLTLLKRMVLYPAPEAESVTVMVYLCGSDLETEAEQATMDMIEMMYADTSEHLNIVMATGGAAQWSSDNTCVDEDSHYYVSCNSDGIKVKDCGEIRNMAEADTLSQFITYSAERFPADRYALILWDHGGGPVYGLCYDEIFDESMSIPVLCYALEDAQLHFDWIGFDCCVMGCAEIAYAIRDYADYMIASEESESGLGWNYTGFLSTLAADPAVEMETLAEQIIDDMIADNKKYRMEATLACYDLSKAEQVMSAVYDYVDDLYALYSQSGISSILTARSKAQDFGDGEYDLVDIRHFATLLPTKRSAALLTAMDEMILISKSYRINNANGMAMWFFENYPNEAVYLSYTMAYYGIDADYIAKLQEMAKAAQAVNAASAGTGNDRSENVLVQAFAKWFAAIR